MTTPAHTPGPWKITESPSSIFIRCGRRTDNHIRDGAPVAVIHKGHPSFTTEEQRTNARLIAAAPEMHTLLDHLDPPLSHDDDCDSRMNRACECSCYRATINALLTWIDSTG